MTLLKRKSALWHGLAILLLDWVSGPLKTGAAQFPQKQHTSHQALTLSNALYLWEGWEGGGVGRIQPVPIVATVQLHLSQQQWDYFYKASDSVPRQQSQLKTSAESTLKAEREECMANGFLFVTLLQHLHSSFALRAQPNGLTSAKCVLKRREGPFQRPRSSSRHPAPLPLHHPPPSPPPLPPPSALVLSSLTLSLSVTCWQGGTVIITQAGFMESRPMAKTKRRLSIPVGNILSAFLLLLSLVLTASLGMHLSDT